MELTKAYNFCYKENKFFIYYKYKYFFDEFLIGEIYDNDFWRKELIGIYWKKIFFSIDAIQTDFYVVPMKLKATIHVCIDRFSNNLLDVSQYLLVLIKIYNYLLKIKDRMIKCGRDHYNLGMIKEKYLNRVHL